jgi:hypothetical protein
MQMVQRQKCEESKTGKSQLTKDAKLIPNLVYNIEKFEQKLIALSKKVKLVHKVLGIKSTIDLQ